MKKSKKLIAIAGVTLMIVATSVTAFAASKYSSPAEALAGLTGRTVESVVAERQETNKSYGAMAKEANKLEEFKKEALEIRKNRLNEQVANGSITQEQADAYIKAMEERQVTCDGTGTGRQYGRGRGMGQGNGCGMGQGFGRGNGLRNGSGLTK